MRSMRQSSQGHRALPDSESQAQPLTGVGGQQSPLQPAPPSTADAGGRNAMQETLL